MRDASEGTEGSPWKLREEAFAAVRAKADHGEFLSSEWSGQRKRLKVKRHMCYEGVPGARMVG